MREFLKRGGWLFLAILFAGTAFAGIYAFVVNSKSSSSGDKYIKCPVMSVTAKQETKDGKVQGTKLAGFTPVKHVNYLKCNDLKVGNGATAKATSTITATYTGALASTGIIFQSSLDTGQPFTTQLTQVIPGWTAGIPGMKVGGTRRLLIPAQYAYGPSGGPGIPPNSDLVFDVMLLGVK
jgi:FKBP-type peptidyl-prolyl cis-trans isomerase FkpA